jgi:uncharacterized protein YecE (DUF72 family)
MKFGKLKNIEGVSFDLGPLSVQTSPSAPKGATKALYVGGTSWIQDHWRGSLYPPRVAKNQYIHHYGKILDCIEFNATFYTIPTAEQVLKWAQAMPEDFKFCPKLYLGIGRALHEEEVQLWTQNFVQSIQHFETKLGPCFVQFPENFTPKNWPLALALLSSWPQDMPLAMEFRNPAFFENRNLIPSIHQFLSDRGIGLVVTDVEGRRDLAHGSYSSNFCLVRFVSCGKGEMDGIRLLEWKKRIQYLYEQKGIVHFFMVHESEAHPSGKLVQKALGVLLNKFGGEEQLSLF